MNKSLYSEKNFWKNQSNYHEFSRDYWCSVLKRDDLSFPFFDNKIICEIGCGPFGIIYFINNAKKKYGVDPLINFYKEIGILKPKDDIILINTDGESVEQIEDKSIDIVICYNVLDHTLNPKRVLLEINRILNDRGILYFHCNSIKALLAPIRKFLKYVDSPHPHHFTKKDIIKLITKSIFDIKTEKYYNFNYIARNFKERIGKVFLKHYSCLCCKKTIFSS